MVSEKFLLFEVGGDDNGLFVTVTHRTTGRKLTARLDPDCGVASTWARLGRELVGEFHVSGDYLFEVGRCQVEGRFGTFHRVIHQPTGRSRKVDSVTGDIRHARVRLLDSLVEELWRAGLLPRLADEAEPHAAADGRLGSAS